MAEKTCVTLSSWGCCTIFYPYKVELFCYPAYLSLDPGETHLVGLSSRLPNEPTLRSPGEVFGGNPGGGPPMPPQARFFFFDFVCFFIDVETHGGVFLFFELARGDLFLFWIGLILSFFEVKLIRF